MHPKKKQYRIKKSKTVFRKGPIHLVDYDIQMPSGRKLSRQILEHSGSAVIIPRLSRDQYILIRQFRFATNGWIWEFPAGGIEKGESLRRAASRELREEIGYKPGKLKKLIEFYASPGISNEKMHIFLAENLKPADGIQDEDEEIESRIFRRNEIERMIRSGKIIDGKTILGFYHLLRNRLV